MDTHVQTMAQVLEEARGQVGGEMYNAPVTDANDRVLGEFPALKAKIAERTVRIALCDVPGPHDHFSIIVKSLPRFTLSLRKEARFDWVVKSFGSVEDHVIGIKEFDKAFVIGGFPPDAVKQFLGREDVRGWINDLQPIDALATGTGFVRASFPLSPQHSYDVEGLRVHVVSMVRLAEAAEQIEVATDEDVF